MNARTDTEFTSEGKSAFRNVWTVGGGTETRGESGVSKGQSSWISVVVFFKVLSLCLCFLHFSESFLSVIISDHFLFLLKTHLNHL